MEDIGTEVSLKIRSAIRAKLMELGAFVDDELPDYIMVMVANKRPRQQMESDLQLFLGSNTLNFTGWLHTVLQKLEEVTIANSLALSQKKAAEVSKQADTAEQSSKSKLPTEGDGHKHKHEKRKKSSKESKSSSKTSSSKKSTKTKGLDASNATSSNGSTTTGCHVGTSDLDSGSKNVDVRTKSEVFSSSNKDVDSQQSILPAIKSLSVSQVGLPAAEKPSLKSSAVLQSDEDDDDFINIKDDAEAMELLDTELSDSHKLPRKVIISPQVAASTSKSKTSSIQVPVATAIGLPDEEVDEDELEQQRANLLRDLKLLDKPSKFSNEKRSSLFERLGSKVSPSSMLDRLGERTDSRPRLNIIDPNELDIVRPTPREVELTKLKVADRLGKRSAAEDKESSPQRSKNQSTLSSTAIEEASRDRRVVSSTKDRRDCETVDRKEEEFDAVKLSIRERLGERLTSAAASKRTVSVVHSERKHSDKPETSRPTVMDRLGKKVDPDSPPGRKVSSHESEAAKPRVTDRLGKKVASDSHPEKKASSPRRTDAAKPSVMDRLGKRQASDSDTERRNTTEREDHTKTRPSRILNIKEALKGELQHVSTSKRHADEQSDDRDEVPRKRSLLSRVVAVKRVPSSKVTEEDEEYDPSNPAVASVIRVKPRPKVPASMQATKNLLLKAMADAQKSVSTAPKRPETQRPESLFTRKYLSSGQPLEKINITVSNPVNKRKESIEVEDEELNNEEEEEESSEEEKREEVSKTKVKTAQQELQAELARKVTQKIVVELPADVKTPEDKDQMAVDEQNNKDSPTDLKIDDENDDDDVIFEEIFDDDLNEEDLIEMTVSNGDSNLGNVSPINNDDNIADTAEYVPTKINNSVKPSHKARASSPQFVVTLDGLDPNIFNPRKRTVDATQSREREEEPGVMSPVPGLDPDTDDRAKKEEERNEQNASPVVYKKPKLAVAPIVEPVKPIPAERCKYWPACSKGDTCEFLHPSMPCKMFPGCKFGDRCLYVHPNCKFDVSCTRRECPYSHTGARGSTSQVQVTTSGKSRPHSQPLCKFYPKCSNVNCSFLHPKPCRFGRACTNRECSFFHEEIPTAEKLKWVNTNRY